PLTPNGKIDRKALPAPVRAVATASTEYVAPSNELEEAIADVWKSLLDLPQVGRQDNIFDLGANSLLTAQANQRLSTKLGKKVSLVSMFRYPTIETLADHLGDDETAPQQQQQKRSQARADRRKDAAARRRAMREAQ
ncbi:MAG: non-ribosomal peptide synthetase, partial [Alphaproteobacteria bacterium]|nr:non-ribosomal peptide synthetase [Alphaproteobacteria bacterium]